MKHLKLFESSSNWTWEKIESNIKDRTDLENKIIENLYFINNTTRDLEEYNIYDIYFDENNNFTINYRDADGQYFNYIVEDKSKFIDFINDPELFIQTNKYNL